MRNGRPTDPAPRTWTVDVLPAPGNLVITCKECGSFPITGHALRTTILSHLAQHARSDYRPAHLRTCQCGEHGCTWHRRHRGCDGALLLLLSRDKAGRRWRLGDVCQSCAVVTDYAAEVRERPRSVGSPIADDDRAARSVDPADGPSAWGGSQEHETEGSWWPASG